jgi:hypothetical protein
MANTIEGWYVAAILLKSKAVMMQAAPSQRFSVIAAAGKRMKYLYLANDVLLQSHKQHHEYTQAFKHVLQEACVHVYQCVPLRSSHLGVSLALLETTAVRVRNNFSVSLGYGRSVLYTLLTILTSLRQR